MNKKIITLISFLILITLVGGFWYLKNNIIENNTKKSVSIMENNKSDSKYTQQRINSEEINNDFNDNNAQIVTPGGYAELVDDNYSYPTDVSKWKTYKNEKYDFRVKYPSEFEMGGEESLQDNTNIHFYFSGIVDKKLFICPTLGLDIYKNMGSFENFDDILSQKEFYVFKDYKFKNPRETLINKEKFLISEVKRQDDGKYEFLNALVAKNNNLFGIEMGSDMGGMPINEQCKNIYYKFLENIKFL